MRVWERRCASSPPSRSCIAQSDQLPSTLKQKLKIAIALVPARRQTPNLPGHPRGGFGRLTALVWLYLVRSYHRSTPLLIAATVSSTSTTTQCGGAHLGYRCSLNRVIRRQIAGHIEFQSFLPQYHRLLASPPCHPAVTFCAGLEVLRRHRVGWGCGLQAEDISTKAQKHYSAWAYSSCVLPSFQRFQRLAASSCSLRERLKAVGWRWPQLFLC